MYAVLFVGAVLAGLFLVAGTGPMSAGVVVVLGCLVGVAWFVFTWLRRSAAVRYAAPLRAELARCHASLRALPAPPTGTGGRFGAAGDVVGNVGDALDWWGPIVAFGIQLFGKALDAASERDPHAQQRRALCLRMATLGRQIETSNTRAWISCVCALFGAVVAFSVWAKTVPISHTHDAEGSAASVARRAPTQRSDPAGTAGGSPEPSAAYEVAPHSGVRAATARAPIGTVRVTADIWLYGEPASPPLDEETKSRLRVTELPAGSSLDLLEVVDAYWYRVRLPWNGVEGFASRRFTEAR